jgi:phosphoserine phosphatase
LLLEAILYGSVQSVQQEEKGTEIEAGWAQFSRLFLLLLGRTEQSVQQAVCTNFEVQNFWVGRTTVQTWHKNRGRKFGTVLGAVSGFSLGWKCVIAAVMYFPEAE